MAIVDHPGIAWITGASSGIGRALTLELARRGWTIVASARSQAGLDRLAAETEEPGSIIPIAVNITDHEAVDALVSKIGRDYGPIDLAILNAGTHVPTPAEDFRRATIEMLVATNLMGTVNCLAALMPIFSRRQQGEIAVVASQTGYRGLPTAAAYGATKAALINMSESLRPELELHNVSLRLINPGFIDTPLTQKNRFPMPFVISPETSARQILKGLATKRFEILTARRMGFLMKALRLAPNWLFLTIARRITPEPGDTPPTQAIDAEREA